jgi:hypothetical protein
VLDKLGIRQGRHLDGTNRGDSSLQLGVPLLAPAVDQCPGIVRTHRGNRLANPGPHRRYQPDHDRHQPGRRRPTIIAAERDGAHILPSPDLPDLNGVDEQAEVGHDLAESTVADLICQGTGQRAPRTGSMTRLPLPIASRNLDRDPDLWPGQCGYGPGLQEVDLAVGDGPLDVLGGSSDSNLQKARPHGYARNSHSDARRKRGAMTT